MIKDETYDKLLSDGLCLDHYFLLYNLKNGITPVSNKRIQGFINLLNKKGYIKDDNITDKAKELLGNDDVESKKVSEVYTNYQKWVVDLYADCQQLLMDLTGKKQIADRINGRGTSFAFLPNIGDMSNKLSKVISVYKIKDLDKIKRTILRHITNCYDAKSWFPLMKYYILKDGESQMVTDMDTIDEDKVEYKSKQKLL